MVRKKTVKRSSSTTLENRVKKWNTDKAKLIREAALIEKEANKRGLSIKLTKR